VRFLSAMPGAGLALPPKVIAHMLQVVRPPVAWFLCSGQTVHRLSPFCEMDI
jgi:hypothetical protein